MRLSFSVCKKRTSPCAARCLSAAARQPRCGLHLASDTLARRGPQVNLLKFKIELLVDMLTLANLDCDKLEDEAAKAKNTS